MCSTAIQHILEDLKANRIEEAKQKYSAAILNIDAEHANKRIAERNIRNKEKSHELAEYGVSLNRANRIFHVNAIFETFLNDMENANNPNSWQTLVFRLRKFCSKYVNDGARIADKIIKTMKP